MKNVRSKQFMEWATGLMIGPDERHEEPRCLVYHPHRQFDRFWEIPESFQELAWFAAHVIDGLDPWSYCRAWPRGGYWPSSEESGNDKEREGLLEAAGIEPDKHCALEYLPEERPRMIALVVLQLHYAQNMNDDVFLLPDHGRQFIHCDHHNVLHMRFADPGQLLPFITHMEANGYFLPEEVPDDLFARPSWMEE